MAYPKPKWREIYLGPNSKIPSLEHTAHTVTQVGRQLYILGGFVDRNPFHLKEFFILDISTMRWSSLHVPQGLDGHDQFSLYGHTATLIDDIILFIGGAIGSLGAIERDSELVFSLDLSLQEFRIVDTVGEDTRRGFSFHSADLLDEREEIVIFGGLNLENVENSHPLYSLHAKTRRLTRRYWKGKKPVDRSSHASCLVKERLYIFGGIDSNEAVLNDMYVLDLSRNVFESSEVKMISPPERRFASVLFYHKGFLFMFGGKNQYHEGPNIRQNDMHRFDLKDKMWYECLEWKATIRPSPRCNYKAVDLGNTLLLFGGTDTSLLDALELSFE